MRKRLARILFLVAALSFAFAGFSCKKKNDNEQIYEELSQEAEAEPEDLIEEEPSEPEPEEEAVEIPVNFQEIWETNEDIYGWIRIPGTVIDYPIVQHPTDDSYYLDHTIEGVKGYPGSIYTESLNQRDFQDGNTVIYGHNMKNGSMFAQLHKYENEDFLRENSTVYIYTPEKIFTYEIFAAVVYDDRHILKSFDFENADSFEEFLSTLKDSRYVSSTVLEERLPSFGDKILTLSTCISNMNENRWLVEAVLTDVQG